MHTLELNYGKLKTTDQLPWNEDQSMFALGSIGWHKCNDNYCISREEGCVSSLLLFTVNGKGIIQLDDREYISEKGSIVFIPRGIKIKYFTVPGGMWEFYWLHTGSELAESFLKGIMQKGNFFASFEQGYQYENKIEEIMRLSDERPAGFELAVSMHLGELLHNVAMQMNKQKTQKMSEKIKRYIENNYRKKLLLDEMAVEMFVSKAHMIREFKKETGDTPHSYLVKYRLKTAAQLLTFGESRIEEIAAESGFSSPSHFISIFKEHYGCTPSDYRSKKQYGVAKTETAKK